MSEPEKEGNMNIDRGKAEAAFRDYVSHYNAEEEKVRLKIEHTFRVAGLCEQIARSLGLEKEEQDLAWLPGFFMMRAVSNS